MPHSHCTRPRDGHPISSGLESYLHPQLCGCRRRTSRFLPPLISRLRSIPQCSPIAHYTAPRSYIRRVRCPILPTRRCLCCKVFRYLHWQRAFPFIHRQVQRRSHTLWISNIVDPQHPWRDICLHTSGYTISGGAAFHRQNDLSPCLLHYVTLPRHRLFTIFSRNHLSHRVLLCNSLPTPNPQPTRVNMPLSA